MKRESRKDESDFLFQLLRLDLGVKIDPKTVYIHPLN